MKIVLYRILGNDLPPLHAEDQTICNTTFILDHEPELEDCEKRWVLNRIWDPIKEGRLVGLLEASHQPYFKIPFIPSVYALCQDRGVHPSVRHLVESGTFTQWQYNRLLYATNINLARNLAIEDGVARADWVLPFDGNICFTESGWRELHTTLEGAGPDRLHFLVPMFRLTDNQDYLHFNQEQHPEHEPQLLFRKASFERFNPYYVYGYDSKIELLKRLGYSLAISPFGVRSGIASQNAGHALRLYPGTPGGTGEVGYRSTLRKQSIEWLLDALEHRFMVGKSEIQ